MISPINNLPLKSSRWRKIRQKLKAMPRTLTVGGLVGFITLLCLSVWIATIPTSPIIDVLVILMAIVLFAIVGLLALSSWAIFKFFPKIQRGQTQPYEQSAERTTPKSDEKKTDKAKPKKEEGKAGGGFLSSFFGTVGILLLLGILGLGASIALPLFQAWATNTDPELAITNFFKDVPSMKIDETPCKEPADHELDATTTEFVVKLKEGCKTLIVTPQNRSNKWRWWEISWVHHLPAPQNCARYQFFGSAGWKGPYCGPENPPDPGNLPDVKGRMYAEGRGELLFRRVQ